MRQSLVEFIEVVEFDRITDITVLGRVTCQIPPLSTY